MRPPIRRLRGEIPALKVAAARPNREVISVDLFDEQSHGITRPESKRHLQLIRRLLDGALTNSLLLEGVEPQATSFRRSSRSDFECFHAALLPHGIPTSAHVTTTDTNDLSNLKKTHPCLTQSNGLLAAFIQLLRRNSAGISKFHKNLLKEYFVPSI